MNIESLKAEWSILDQKIEASQKINERLIESIIKEKSLSRVTRIKNQYHGFFIMLVVEIILMIAILAGNPFDFTYKIQFLPYVILGAGILVAFINLLSLYKKLNPKLAAKNVGHFLEQVIDNYEKNKKFEKWFGYIFLSIGLMMPLSFLPQKLDRNPVYLAVGETLLMMCITLVLYLVAFRLGAFENRHTDKFREYLAELNDLKQVASELRTNP